MAFTIRGVLPYDDTGQVRSVEWKEPGRLSGDDLTLTLLRIEAARLEGVGLGIPGTARTHTAVEHLQDPVSVQSVAYRLFGDTMRTRGDVPAPFRTPKGSQA